MCLVEILLRKSLTENSLKTTEHLMTSGHLQFKQKMKRNITEVTDIHTH